jgi:type VI protein secretion system component VasF
LDYFKECCPACGYSAPSEGASEKKALSPAMLSSMKEHEQVTESLPMWVYLVTGLALIVTVVVVSFTFKGALGF